MIETAQIEKASEKSISKDTDYLGDDGLMYCGKCKTAKQIRIDDILGVHRTVYCMCTCMAIQYEQEQKENMQRQMQIQISRNKQNAFGYGDCDCDRKLLDSTFELDDGKNEKLSKICRRYAQRFHSGIKWLVLYGNTDAGKTFGAACIANELLDSGYSVRFVTVSQVEKRLWDTKSKSEVYGDLANCDLLILDDLGAERDSEYMDEIIFNILDDRLRSGKPMIITTNTNLTEMRDEIRVQKQRIFSRLCERSAFFKCEQVNRRKENARAESAAFINDLLQGD